ncbi:MAG: FAD-binding oxidoreductase, partial [Patescibacteria group bacterium]
MTTLRSIASSKPRLLVTTVEKKEYLTPTALMVRLHLARGEAIHFKAGQHIVLKIPAGDAVFDRPFSIASSPQKTDSFDLFAKIISGG